MRKVLWALVAVVLVAVTLGCVSEQRIETPLGDDVKVVFLGGGKIKMEVPPEAEVEIEKDQFSFWFCKPENQFYGNDRDVYVNEMISYGGFSINCRREFDASGGNISMAISCRYYGNKSHTIGNEANLNVVHDSGAIIAEAV